uniref:TIL domain-containing protein n=1 Tax=Steinernema glaseri TaxID=37863 RepID=A0A1I7ZCP4_9BILA
MEAFLTSILTELLLVSVKCGTNEEYIPCGPCDSVCGAQIVCASVCQPLGGCGCAKDHVRNSAGKCIPKAECPKTESKAFAPLVGTNSSCPEFETFSKAGKCDRTCQRPTKNCYRVQHEPGCRCIPGYVRNEEKKCVPISTCVSAVFKR